MYKLPILLLLFVNLIDLNHSLLYHRDSETRDHKSLDGIWNFIVPDNDEVAEDFLLSKDLHQWANGIPMPVPASYNDITTNSTIRDYVGKVLYERTFFVPTAWNNTETRVWLRFGSVCYAANVSINGQLAVSHEIGHLPFEKDVTSFLHFGTKNRIALTVDNSLSSTSVPQGSVQILDTENGKVKQLSHTYDYFDYTGIDRPVLLYTTPKTWINDLNTTVDVNNNVANIHYNVSIHGIVETKVKCTVTLYDRTNAKVVSSDACEKGELKVDNPKLWWPYLMHRDPAYLYQLEVKIFNASLNTTDQKALLDVYRLPFGIRTLRWTNKEFLINEKPVYMRGLGRHEDSDIRGKGVDLPLIVRDYNLLNWLGVNAYRTSHYPYAEEIMDFADQMGIMIIDECPSGDTKYFDNNLLQNHKRALTQLIQRDKNRPSVIAWSISNEPYVNNENKTKEYFEHVVQHVKSMDQSRPVTAAIAVGYNGHDVGFTLDIIGFNRYNAWYANTGRTDMIKNNIWNEANGWHNKFNKPIMMTEYGGDTVAGIHDLPASMWSEDYQVKLMSKHFEDFDRLRKNGTWFIGEFIWNFADFQTPQSTSRANGNKKGVFTRQRQPKASAHFLRQRYWSLARELDKAVVPGDVFPYVNIHNEL